MQRKETYATTGPRMIVRFFGGWDFETADANTRMPGDVGYTKGVPMGGDLRDAPAGKAPTFLVAALKDPIGANLDRIQIIKGWLDAKGETHEKVYDVVWSGDRKPDAEGQAPARREHRGCGERDLDQHHRRARTDHGLERPGVRSGTARLLLRARHRNPHAALDRLRREVFRHQDAAGSPDDYHGARLHLADLVHAGEMTHPHHEKTHARAVAAFLPPGGGAFSWLTLLVSEASARQPGRLSSRREQIDVDGHRLSRTWQRPPTR